MAEPQVVEHQVVEHRQSGTSSGVMIGLVLALLVAVVVAFFLFAGGPARFTGNSNPGQTNVNVPAQQQPSGPNIEIPRQIDVNINQPAPQVPAQPPVSIPGS
jgi:flagellar basal body-associated protein FliL